MAEIVDDIMKKLNDTNNMPTEPNLKRIPASTEGMLIAYTSLVVMALVPIFLGSFRSVKLHIKNKVSTIIIVFQIILVSVLLILFSISAKKRNTGVYDRKGCYDVSTDC